MGLTIAYEPGAFAPTPLPVPIIEWKASWADEWTFEPEFQFARASHVAAGSGLGSMEFTRPYGRSKMPWDVDFSDRVQWEIRGYWVRLSFVYPGGTHLAFVGRVSSESRQVMDTGDPDDETRVLTGMQTWIAYGARQELTKTAVSRSHWLVGDSLAERELGWIPDMNRRDERGLLVGNRSAEPSLDGDYRYGGTSKWTRLQYCEYVLERFMSTSAGPQWRMAGDTTVLGQLQDHVRMGAGETVADILGRLISPRLGIDYVVEPYEDGFQLYVYELGARSWEFNGATVPVNPFTVSISSPMPRNVARMQLVSTLDQQRAEIRVVGSRIVSCTSLRSSDGSLVPKWSPALELEYKQGTGNPADSLDEHNAVRTHERFRPVYQVYGAPDDWDFNQGKAAPELDGTGGLIGGGADHQRSVRRTLPFLPLREGVDYSTDPPTDPAPGDHQPDLKPPMVFARWEQPWPGAPKPYRSIDDFYPLDGIGVHVSGTDWGIFLNASPNHRLAAGHFDDALPVEAATNLPIDYETLVATLALETDQRLELRYQAIESDEDPSVVVIEVPDAEYWFMPAGTVIGVDDGGQLIVTDADQILRDDSALLSAVMAGALARYAAPRSRATVTWRGIEPVAALVGRVLVSVKEAGEDLVDIDAPITSVEWTAPPQLRGDRGGHDAPPAATTVLRAGFA